MFAVQQYTQLLFGLINNPQGRVALEVFFKPFTPPERQAVRLIFEKKVKIFFSRFLIAPPICRLLCKSY
jgi:hypothetical protein